MPTYDVKCQSCEWSGEVFTRINDPLPPCPHCQGVTEKWWKPSNRHIITDESYIGGLTLHNLGHTPVTVYSNAERLKIMKERGLRENVYHCGTPGSDKSPMTTTWNIGLPPGVDARPFAHLTPDEQEARHREWLATEPPDSPLLTNK